MVTVPAETPVIKPVPLPAVAMPVLLLTQEPPGVLLANVTELPTHTDDGPVMSAGMGSTEMVRYDVQPEGNV